MFTSRPQWRCGWVCSKINIVMLVVLIAVSLIPSLSDCQCVYTLPSSKGCAQFDLTLLAHYGPYNISSPDGSFYKYYVKVCDVITTDMPDICVSKKPSPAYKYLHDCRILGDIMQGYAYPLDPLDISKGISIAYTGGEGGVDGYWPTAVIYDLYCDTSGVSKLPTVLYEWPEATFRVMWRTGYACPQIIQSKKCRKPHPPSGWDGNRFRNYPQWYNDAKFGILVTWGVFSVPAYGNESYWYNLMNGDPDTVQYHNKVYGCSGVDTKKFPCKGSNFMYQDFAPMFKAEYFDPDQWANLFKMAGAKYVVLTTMYRSGWCNFPSPQHYDWNSVDTGPRRDLTGNLTNSVRSKGLKMGFHHSLTEWYNPLIKVDRARNCSSGKYVKQIMNPTLKQLVNDYKPDLLLGDGITDYNDCSQDSVKYLKTDKFLQWLYTESSVQDTIITNSNWGVRSFGSYEGGSSTHPMPFLKYKWELPYGIQNDSFGFNYKYNLTDIRNVTDILWHLMATVSNNGNFLLNIGPMANGTIHPLFVNVLVDIGKWMAVNSDAVFNTIPWKHQTNSTTERVVWYTASVDFNTVYAVLFVTASPGEVVLLSDPVADLSKTHVYMITGTGDVELEYKVVKGGGISVIVPAESIIQTATVPWCIKMTNVT